MPRSSRELKFPTGSLLTKRLRPKYVPPTWIGPQLEKVQREWEAKELLAGPAALTKRSKSCPVKRLSCGVGLEARYEVLPWKRVAYGSAVQERSTYCGIFENTELLATVEFLETRNASPDAEMSVAHYVDECDAVSQRLYDHGMMCVTARGELEGFGGGLMPKERLAEISELWITPAARARLLWAKPLPMLIRKLFSGTRGCYVVALKAFPLEYATTFGERISELYEVLGEEAAAPVIERESYLKVRRTVALMNLYTKHLGFNGIEGTDGLMFLPV